MTKRELIEALEASDLKDTAPVVLAVYPDKTTTKPYILPISFISNNFMTTVSQIELTTCLELEV